MDASSPTSDPLALQRRYARGLATREKLLDATLLTVAAQGYGGAGVAEIALAAGLTKNHLFQQFRSKEELIQAALLRAANTWLHDVAQAAQIFPQAERQLAHAVQALDVLNARGWHGLAFIASLAQVRGGLPPALAAGLDMALDEMAGFFRDAFKEARKAGRLGPDAKPRQLAQLCLGAVLGAGAAGGNAAEQLTLLAALCLPAAGAQQGGLG
jgi:AcrR family transcriptional regulator